jgi:hypothetical protein
MSTINRHVWAPHRKKLHRSVIAFLLSSIALPALIVTVFVSSAHAQTPSSLQGKVFDPSNAVIVGATITAIPTQADNGPTAVSNQEGLFALPSIPGNTPLRSVQEISSRSRNPSRSAARPRRGISCCTWPESARAST